MIWMTKKLCNIYLWERQVTLILFIHFIGSNFYRYFCKSLVEMYNRLGITWVVQDVNENLSQNSLNTWGSHQVPEFRSSFRAELFLINKCVWGIKMEDRHPISITWPFQNLYHFICFIITGITINTILSNCYQGYAHSSAKEKMSLNFSIGLPLFYFTF